MPQQKNLMSSYLDICLKLFRLEVPQMIGSAATDASGALQVKPPINAWVGSFAPVEHPLRSLKEYAFFLLSRRREAALKGVVDEDKTQVCATLDELQAMLLPHIDGLNDPALLRCILRHDDMNPGNLLIDTSGAILGVLDWEFHSIVPAVIAVSVPPWLPKGLPLGAAKSSDLAKSPETTQSPDTKDNSDAKDQPQAMWLFSGEESQELSNHFEELARQRDMDFYNILKRGEFIRSALAWVDHQPRFDPGLYKLRAWMTSVAAGP
ncbi:hypothetical protein HGRIS_009636 [Hohenbuehelia grisea]|uniref:Aminoglycoside phosphotransferase domain-containing protein n=1 Tax=Hohenbuehelia grisea TaxID=104357 RepID=A0ABR3J272_9AGAR